MADFGEKFALWVGAESASAAKINATVSTRSAFFVGRPRFCVFYFFFLFVNTYAARELSSSGRGGMSFVSPRARLVAI